MRKKFRVKSLELKVKSLKLGVLIFIFSLLTFHFSLLTCEAKVYIDITSPAMKKLPIAIQEFTGQHGKTITDIITGDLDFTGFFLSIDRGSHIENPANPFNPANWKPLGAEAVVKGTVTISKEGITVTASLHDVLEAREIFKKTYTADQNNIRRLGHTIANDIYRELTGENGIFRTQIAFVAEDEGKKGLYIMDWDGSGIKRLGIRGNFVLTPHWAKTGNKLIYSSERGRQWGIYLLDFTKMTENILFASQGLNMTGNFFPGDNEIVFSSSKDETFGLYVLNMSDKRIRRLTTSRWIDISPAVSPDGKTIAFVSDRGGSPQIYTMHKDGYDVKRLTFEGSYNTSPSWSPAGDKLVFVGRSNGKHQIFTVNADGSGLIQLTDAEDNEDPSFSFDGRFIIFTSNRDRKSGIYIMRANGESQKKITPEWIRAFGPRWSPN